MAAPGLTTRCHVSLSAAERPPMRAWPNDSTPSSIPFLPLPHPRQLRRAHPAVEWIRRHFGTGRGIQRARVMAWACSQPGNGTLRPGRPHPAKLSAVSAHRMHDAHRKERVACLTSWR